MTELGWMLLPVLACTVIVLTLGWFGLHVLERGVIFVDLALAQVAALGTTWAVFLGHEPDGPTSFALSLVFTFIGAVAFSAARMFEERVPQEAIIGIAYAVSAAFGMLMIHFADDPHGGEKLEHLLVGNLVWVQVPDLLLLAGVCGVVGLFHLAFRERFLQISFRPVAARAEGRRIAMWDLLFYLSFGFALTAIVSVSGVLLVFSYLVIPAVIARLTVTGVTRRLLVGWAVGLVVSVAGVAVSYEHPTGPVIVSFFGVALQIVLTWYAVRHAPNPGKRALSVLGIVAALGAVLWGFAQVPPTAEEHDHEAHEEEVAAPASAGEPLAAATPEARDAAARDAVSHPERDDALAAALAAEPDPSVKLTLAVVLVKNGDRRGLDGLAALTAGDVPFVRMEADSRLRQLAGATAPVYDPLSGPDTGAWAAWASAQAAVPPEAAAVMMP